MYRGVFDICKKNLPQLRQTQIQLTKRKHIILYYPYAKSIHKFKEWIDEDERTLLNTILDILI